VGASCDQNRSGDGEGEEVGVHLLMTLLMKKSMKEMPKDMICLVDSSDDKNDKENVPNSKHFSCKH
jgi:hypothetical protein